MKGVNAVHENDVAVAHCYAVVQRRLGKAEEAYMKAMIHQSRMRSKVEDARRELVRSSSFLHAIIMYIYIIHDRHLDVGICIGTLEVNRTPHTIYIYLHRNIYLIYRVALFDKCAKEIGARDE
jgi:hypothetical protein